MARCNHPHYENPAGFARMAFLRGYIAMHEMIRVMQHAEEYFMESSWDDEQGYGTSDGHHDIVACLDDMGIKFDKKWNRKDGTEILPDDERHKALKRMEEFFS